MREVEEETGVGNLTIIAALPTTLHLFHRNGKYRLKKTYWYAMETDHNDELVPQLEEGFKMWYGKVKMKFLNSIQIYMLTSNTSGKRLFYKRTDSGTIDV